MERYFVKESDIGKGGAMSNGLFEPLGRVQPQDVGKMLVKVGDVWQAENNEQFKKRTGK